VRKSMRDGEDGVKREEKGKREAAMSFLAF
jgi:hypothetical protein